MPDEKNQDGPFTCCPYRRKIVVGIVSVLPEEKCGVPDSYLADVLNFEMKTPSGHPVLAFRFCPWCGKPRKGEFRITDRVEK